MPTKRSNPKSRPEVVEEEKNLIDREVFDWGVRLTARPFRGTAQDTMTIISEIRNYRERRGSGVLITMPAITTQRPFRLIDARAWHGALGSIVKETAAVQVEMRTTAKSKKKG
jgi:hypothetical protein